MKRILFMVLMCLGFVFTLTACSDDKETKKTQTEETQTETEEIDLSNVSFGDQSFEYTGNPFELSAFFVPENVNVEYTINGVSGNSATEIGVYTVTATFKDTKGNVLDTRTATLTIKAVSVQLYFMCAESGWENNEAYLFEDVDGVLEFTIDLEAGTEFKVANSDDWDGTQWNIGGQFGDYKAFTNGINEDNTANDNVKVKEAGSYTFYINPSLNTLKVEKDGTELEKVNGTVYYVKGEINGWTCAPAQRLVLASDGTTASVTVTLVAGQQFKISDNAWTDSITYGWTQFQALNMEQFASGAEYGNVKCLANGTYKFTISNYSDPYKNFSKQVLTVEIIEGGVVGEIVATKNAYYIRGGVNNWLDGAEDKSAWAFNVEGDVATFTITLNVGDAFKIAPADNWSVSFGYNESLAGNFEAGENNNIVTLNAGTYLIKIVNYGTFNESLVIEKLA